MLSLMFAQASLSPLPGRNTAVIAVIQAVTAYMASLSPLPWRNTAVKAVIQAVTAYMASLSPLEHCTMKEQEQEGFL